jgi:acetyl-CoA carboxylase carboxyl transferase subunit beta
VVFLTDTLGAKPTIEAEQAGQSAEIAETILAINEYPEPVMSFVVGALGSGGGLGTTPRGDFFAMLENSMVFVAEPFSATTILYNNSNPSVEDVKRTLCRMRATAKDQLDLGFIDEIIPESKNPNLTAENIYYTLARVIIDLQKQSKRKRLKDRDKKIRGLRGFEINRNGNTQNPADID